MGDLNYRLDCSLNPDLKDKPWAEVCMQLSLSHTHTYTHTHGMEDCRIHVDNADRSSHVNNMYTHDTWTTHIQHSNAPPSCP